MSPRPSARTIAAVHGVATDPGHGAVTPPLHLSSTFAFAGFEQERQFAYTRVANPTRDLLAETLAQLEEGAGAVVTCSGMAAIDLLIAIQPADALIIAQHDSYSGAQRLLQARAAKGQLRLALVDLSDTAAWRAALAQGPSLVFLESPSNPLLRVVDIAALSHEAKAAGAKVAVDNTFLSPALQQPLRLGADFVVHSTTKFLNGHSDVVGGAVVAADPGDVEALRSWANIAGLTGAPFDAYMTLRGVRTLFVRVEQQQRTALAIAAFLAAHPAVKAVHYPGLESHPGHAIARAQQRGFGAMLSFELAGGRGQVGAFLEGLALITLAESLGGIESLIAHPATMTHASMTPEARAAAGIEEGLLRLSVGLEAEADLIEDLRRALESLA